MAARDKVNKLAHTVADALADLDAVDFIEDRNTIRQECRKDPGRIVSWQKQRSTSMRGRRSRARSA